MFYWGIALLAINVVLLAGIFYLLIARGGVNDLSMPAVRGASSDAGSLKSEAGTLISELKEELSCLRKAGAQIERKWVDLDGYERIFDDRVKKIDNAINKAEERLKDPAYAQASDSPTSGDAYSRAVRLLKRGLPTEEVVDRLGLLKGEAELITALNSYKC